MTEYAQQMKILNVCETPLLAIEVNSLLKENPRNAMAFTDRDPLENPDITNPDDLRRYVSVRRCVSYMEHTLHLNSLNPCVLPKVLSVLLSHGLSKDMIARLVDSIVLSGSPESSRMYVPLILGDRIPNPDQVEKIRAAVWLLANPPSDEAELESILDLCKPDSTHAEPPSKRRSSTRKR
jgi:hypothetical protein